MEDAKIVIVDFGSQTTKLIELSLREIGYRSAVLPPKRAELWIKNKKPKAIILSGSPLSVNDRDSPPRWMSPLCDMNIPILGICYGMQYVTKMLGALVVSVPKDGEYGPSKAKLESSELFMKVPKEIDVWASHGDTVASVPRGFVVIARTPDGAIAAMQNRERRIWGVQFHPEVKGTPFGKQILANFVVEIAGCEQDWQPSDMVKEIETSLISAVGKDRAIIAFSGGVDSTTLSAIAGKVLGKQVKDVCIDGGQLREGEIEEIRRNAKFAGVSLTVMNVQKQFQRMWNANRKHEPDPELKRKLFPAEYIKCLAKVAKPWKAKFFIQGTLAPDMIESGKTGGDLIKSHHNVGVKLPGCTSLHPFAHLFKYEVRALAKNIGLPDSVVERQPFPGPGLFIRVKNGWPTKERLEILSWADGTVRRIAGEFRILGEISQLVVSLPCGKSVGVKGDERVYGYDIVVKGVKTLDFMTAEAYEFPPEAKRAITPALTKHPSIVNVLWNETPKPPATIEPE